MPGSIRNRPDQSPPRAGESAHLDRSMYRRRSRANLQPQGRSRVSSVGKESWEAYCRFTLTAFDAPLALLAETDTDCTAFPLPPRLIVRDAVNWLPTVW